MDSCNQKQDFSKIEQAIPDIKKGKVLIIVDDCSEKNEGVFFVAAEKASPKSINFMMTHGKSLICLATPAERLKQLNIPMMVSDSPGTAMAAFAVSIDLKHKQGTGVSAADRAATIKAFTEAGARSQDFVMPGHIFPLRAQPGGVLARAGHTESAVDLSRLSGLYPAGVICEVINQEGEVALLLDLVAIAREFGLKIVTIEELIRYRKRKEKLVEKVSEIIECKAADIENLYQDVDIVISTTQLPPKISKPQVSGIPFITGNELDETKQKLIDLLRD